MADDHSRANLVVMNQSGKVKVHFLIWPSIILSLLLTLALNLIIHLFR
jgi:hypothetical protein